VGFDEVDLELESGLVVITGASGAGKSVLLSSLLGIFGYDVASAAKLCEVTMLRPRTFNMEEYELGDEIVLKQIKKEKIRYFIDGQSISKKRLKIAFAPYVKYLSAREQSGLESDALVAMIDSVASEDKAFVKLKKEYRKRYRTFVLKRTEYEALLRKEREAAERREFLRFEIDKIAAVDPKEGEEEELMELKKRLSRLDKLEEAVTNASEIFRFTSAVEAFYTLSEKDSALFDEAMNQLRADLDDAEAMRSELEEIDVEGVLDRIAALNALTKRFGSIAAALEYKAQKEEELARLEHIEEDKTHLQRYLELEHAELTTLASRLSHARKQAAASMMKALSEYLEALKLSPLEFTFERVPLEENGTDKLDIKMEGSDVKTLSGGEFNRVRLALMAVSMANRNDTSGIVILDEIDANVSGEESIAIAHLIEKIASAYQVFAISHQPHLSAKAHQHILVRKQGGKSSAVILDERGRIEEIARIVGGEKPSSEAMEFAKKLRT
jgi:DNA repair protein RecN (Recombination protein N)